MKITINTKVYPLEAILNTCYVFIDRAYIFLSGNPGKGKVEISIKGKNKISSKQKEPLVSEFKNELLHCALRQQVSRNNKKIREYIIGRALFSMLPVAELTAGGGQEGYQKDSLGIASTWEEKYGKKKKFVRSKV